MKGTTLTSDFNPETTVIPPHGGKLVDRRVPPQEREAFLRSARALPRVRLNGLQASDVEMIAIGAFSPLVGFMGQADYRAVVEHMHLAGGLPWSMPVTLAVDQETARRVRDGQEIALEDEEGRLLGTMALQERYAYDKEEQARKVYGTTEEAHAGVANVYAQGPVMLGGPIRYVGVPREELPFPEYRLEPVDTRRAFQERGWKTVVGFQTRNPVHRAHEYIQKCAMEVVDGLLLHPLVGATKGDDIPAEVRMRCYQVLLERYYPQDRVLLSVNPAFMRYAGPREAIFHALVRKNYGCSHFIVGRDHAGVGNYYGTYAAQHIFREFQPGELGIQPLFFENSFFCRACGSMGTAKTCPHDSANHVFLSGTQVRNILSKGEMPPVEFSRPEVAAVLMEAYRQR
ncbi:MAG: sulfate adenylyltransferase [Chloroflexi bacterium]|nr:sulfate adenylyltransferase [Chloroflexota bacterium]